MDSIKGLVMLIIIAGHSGLTRMDEVPLWIRTLLGSGDRAVQAYILISACLACASYKRNKENGGKTSAWLAQRIFRLLPLYYLGLLVNYVIKGPNYMWLYPDKVITPWNWLGHIFSLNCFIPNYCNSFGFEWYVGIAMLIYVFMPMMYRICMTLRKAIVVTIISIPICIWFQNGLSEFLIPTYQETLATTFATYFFVTAHVPCICLGVVLYHFIEWIKNNELIANSRKAVSSVLIFCAILLYVLDVLAIVRIDFIDANTRSGIIWFILSVGLSFYSYTVIDNKVMILIGNKSYTFYIFNYVIIWFVNGIFDRFNIQIMNPVMIWFAKYVVELVVLALLAVLLDRYYDRPIYLKLVGMINK